jgi:hypothetical protein
VVPTAGFVVAPAFHPLEEETSAKVEISKASTCFVSFVALLVRPVGYWTMVRKGPGKG